MTKPLSAIILAAGKGTRMKSDLPKVMHKMAGAPMLWHVLNATENLDHFSIQEKVVVTGHGGEMVRTFISEIFPKASCVIQEEQLGTGHAVLQAEKLLSSFEGDVLILSGDVPLINRQLVEQFAYSHAEQENDITAMTAFVEDPTGLGRIIRDKNDDFQAIVEHKDATEEQRKINEINGGLYIVKSPKLFELLKQVGNNNASREYYLPDIITLALEQGLTIGTFTAPDAETLGGVNTKLQLAYSEDYYQNIKREDFLVAGVSMQDPQSVFFSYDTKIGKDVFIGPFTRFGENTTIESNVNIEGNCYIENSYINEKANILSFCHLSGAVVGANADIGPFCRLRPEANLGANSKAGSFVEIKKSKIGKDSKVPHLSYVGDAEIGEDVNIGGGTIFANYNSMTKVKSKTIIEDGASIGAGNTLIAPLTIGEKSMTGANATIRKDVAAKALAISSGKQIVHENYVKEEETK